MRQPESEDAATAPAPVGVMAPEGLGVLLSALQDEGYQLIGPTLRDQAIVYDEIDGAEDLPAGWTDEQDGGYYRLKKREDGAIFGYAVGPDSWKKFLFKPSVVLWNAKREGKGFTVTEPEEKPVKRAFIGVRSCELHAIAIQDKVFLAGEYTDPHYAAARQDLFLVAVNCAVAGGTCFCASMGTGPKVESGADLVLTECLDGDRHFFLLESGSEAGRRVLEAVPHKRATKKDQAAAAGVVKKTAEWMGRSMDTTGIRDLLRENLEHPQWDDVADRCLACGNCTMVCPTCFCSTVEDVTDLSGQKAERRRVWDSCYSQDFSYIHGGSVRTGIRSRYRQWMTHKLSSWIDQFGSSGCVGCGRCITWCPVGIDLTEEVESIRSHPMKKDKQTAGGE